ncbi:MAG TPA: mannosyltransferase family protein [Anaerolineales bacterium]|nr:mannosyltransferase family protein [Anaerolineales bacterium]HND92949.1 mannosyltransferase family protein [Anaerolineales bacterium]HNE69149.1 mannosyltransferase family protein [Anaerolineales bacterium]HNF35694.1 mannosyltransferase family protein [Anaerolineales bacterium]HNO85308.1 mannosyltransferase family protein [Anaerolineales bacterium]
MKKLPAWLLIPLLAFSLSRLLIFGAGILADTMLPTEEGHWIADENSPFLSMWTKWDSQYYVDIATDGYWFRPKQQSNVAFFPLYPMLMRVTSKLLGGNLILTGVLLSNLAFLGALIFFYLLTEREFDSDSARRAVFYLAFFPTSFFFSSLYTESLFVLLSVATMYYARTQRWVPATILGMLTAATRNLGILMWALVLWEWLRVQGWSFTAMHKKQTWLNLWNGFKHNWFQVIIISLIPLGMLAYIYFLQVNFQRPLAFIETQAAWGRENIGPIAVLQKNITALMEGEVNKGWLTRFWNVTTMLFFLALVPFIWFRLGEGYAIFVLIMLLVPSASAVGSIIRYVLTQFPAFMLMGWWGRREAVDRTFGMSFAVLLGVFVSIFVNWIFVA